MNRDERYTHVEVDVAGRVVATADVEEQVERGVVRASLQVAPGHQPTGSRTRLVDAVLDLPEVHDQQRLEATLPIGDSEILERLRERCKDIQTRPAGATCLVDADLPEADSPLQAPAASMTTTATPSHAPRGWQIRARTRAIRAEPSHLGG